MAATTMDISREAAERVAGEVGGKAAVRSMVEQVVADHGRLDVAVNAGIGGDQVPTGEYPVESWRKVLSVNLDGVFYCMRHELPAMVAGGGGAIVNMASILASDEASFVTGSYYTVDGGYTAE